MSALQITVSALHYSTVSAWLLQLQVQVQVQVHCFFVSIVTCLYTTLQDTTHTILVIMSRGGGGSEEEASSSVILIEARCYYVLLVRCTLRARPPPCSNSNQKPLFGVLFRTEHSTVQYSTVGMHNIIMMMMHKIYTVWSARFGLEKPRYEKLPTTVQV